MELSMVELAERVAEHGATLAAMQSESHDCWVALHKLTDNVDAMGKQVAELITLSKQPHTKEQCIIYDRLERAEDRVDALESKADKAGGTVNTIQWILGGGNLATLAAIIYFLWQLGQHVVK